MEHHQVYGSSEGRQQWVTDMKDIEFAVPELEKHAAQHAGVSKWKDGEKQHASRARPEANGFRISQQTGDLLKPYEKEQW